MVSSRVYPSLERKPGGPDNWVEAAGGLPDYIERIAKHLHYERGYSISRAIATAVNTVKRWARGGHVTKHGTTKRVSPATVAKAAAAVASWEAKKRAGSLAMTGEMIAIIDLSAPVSDEFTFNMLEWEETSADLTEHGILANINLTSKDEMNIAVLAERANRVEDPIQRATARQAVFDLAVFSSTQRKELANEGKAMSHGGFPIRNAADLKNAVRAIGRAKNPVAARQHIIRRARALGLTNLLPDKWDLTSNELNILLDLASTIAPRKASGNTKDGRPSFKKQGKWAHGFVPVDQAAKESKAKGSPIAMRRMGRLFGKAATGRAGQRSGGSKTNTKDIKISEKANPGSERTTDIAQLRHSRFDTKGKSGKTGLPKSQKEASKSSRIPARASQNWDEIPESLKTIRGGKRYVLAEFGGKQYVTAWVGGVQDVTSTPLSKRKVMRTLSSKDAADMTTTQLRDLIDNPQVSASVKRVARRELKAKVGKP